MEKQYWYLYDGKEIGTINQPRLICNSKVSQGDILIKIGKTHCRRARKNDIPNPHFYVAWENGIKNEIIYIMEILSPMFMIKSQGK